MYYIIYETTNKVNGKRYRGAHSTPDINDDYLGSGHALCAAIKKYGRNNFERRILSICKTEDEMWRKEQEFITEEFVNDPSTYNLRVGGKGGSRVSQITRLRMSAYAKNMTIEHRVNLRKARKGKPISESHRIALQLGNKRYHEKRKTSGERKRLTPEHCDRISKALKGKRRPNEVIEKMKAAVRPRHSEATKQKISETMKRKRMVREHL